MEMHSKNSHSISPRAGCCFHGRLRYSKWRDQLTDDGLHPNPLLVWKNQGLHAGSHDSQHLGMFAGQCQLQVVVLVRQLVAVILVSVVPKLLCRDRLVVTFDRYILSRLLCNDYMLAVWRRI